MTAKKTTATHSPLILVGLILWCGSGTGCCGARGDAWGEPGSGPGCGSGLGAGGDVGCGSVLTIHPLAHADEHEP